MFFGECLQLILAAKSEEKLCYGNLAFIAGKINQSRNLPVDVLPDTLHVIPVRHYTMLHRVLYTKK
jgi:hypothetical protein